MLPTADVRSRWVCIVAVNLADRQDPEYLDHCVGSRIVLSKKPVVLGNFQLEKVSNKADTTAAISHCPLVSSEGRYEKC